MLRYIVISAILVVGVVAFVAGWTNRDLIRIRIASVYASAAPKRAPPDPAGETGGRGLRGDASWALSAFPECLIQTSESTGSLGYVLQHLPRRAVAIRPPSVLRYGNCTIFLVGDEAYVRRGNDRFRIPPRVRFYRAPDRLALLRETSNGNELRVYQFVKR